MTYETEVEISSPENRTSIKYGSVFGSEVLLNHTAPYSGDELHRFQSSLSWIGLDQSTTLHVVFSWILFLLFTVVVPLVDSLIASCQQCSEEHQHPFDKLVQYSESALAAVSFVCLSRMLRRHGLSSTLFLDKINWESIEVQRGYEKKLRLPLLTTFRFSIYRFDELLKLRLHAFSTLAVILLPCFIIELVHQVLWRMVVSITFIGIRFSSWMNIVMCCITALSWLYKTAVFLFMCVLIRLMCSLQILRLQGYNKLLEHITDVHTILTQHMRIRDQLSLISHRVRSFLLVSLLVITLSQLWSLFFLITSARTLTFFRAGDLMVCSVVQLTGLVLCLHGAARITHRAQQIVGTVSRWHAIVTCSPVEVLHSENQSSERLDVTTYGPTHPLLSHDSSNELLMSLNVYRAVASEPSQHDSDAFNKRQALVTYLQHAGAGISVYGFVLNRDFLYAIFAIEFSLALFILGKTILL